MKRLLVVAVILLSSVFSYARIGETKEECEKRYGAPISKKNENYWVFSKSGILIAVEFFEGVGECIFYRKKEEDIIGNPEEFSDNEKEILLKSNSDSPWKKKPALSFNEEWTTEDDLLGAVHLSERRLLIVATIKYFDRQAKETKDKEKENLDGF